MKREHIYLYRWELASFLPDICRRGATLEEIGCDYFRVTFAT